MQKLPAQNMQALELILNYWLYYSGEDKFFIYNPYTKKFILGVEAVDDFTNATFTLYPMKFFADNVKSCAKAFKYYCVIENGKITHNSFENFMPIDVLSVSDLLKAFMTDAKSNSETGDVPSLFKRKKHNIIRQDDSYDSWKQLFDNIQLNIEAKKFEKVVASRKINFQSVDGFNFTSIILNLFEANINSYIFAHEENGSIFFGASPELLIEKTGSKMKSYALAGTIKKTAEDVIAQGQSFLNDKKNIYEHNIVINAIAQSMQKLGKNIHIGTSHILELKNVLHIKTDICADEHKKNDTHENLSILNWVSELHPTPALGGSPKDKVLSFIKKYESFTRGYFGAPLGVVDALGNGFFIVAIRSATIQDNLLSAYAGCGIVAQSDCDEEFEEIDIKLKTIIEAL